MTDRRVIVTGASGFVGRALLPQLAAAGWEVHALGRQARPGADCAFHAADLLEDDLRPLFRQIQAPAMIHLAWYAEPGAFWHHPVNLDWVAASLRLATAFAGAGGGRLIAAGSCAEYDWQDGRLDERKTALVPATLYGQAKASLFALLDKAAPALGLSLAWGRIFFPYGADERPERLIGSVMDGIIHRRPIELTSGTQRRDFMHVQDVAGAFAAMLESDIVGPINIGSGEGRVVRDLARMLADAEGCGHLLHFGGRALQPGEPPLIEAAIDRLTHDLKFTPRFAIADGLRTALAQRRRIIESRTTYEDHH